MAFYIFAEDLVSGLVGPFETREAAENHIVFCEARGDADPGRVVTAAEAATMDVMITMTPDEDAAFDTEHPVDPAIEAEAETEARLADTSVESYFGREGSRW